MFMIQPGGILEHSDAVIKYMYRPRRLGGLGRLREIKISKLRRSRRDAVLVPLIPAGGVK